MNSAQIIEGTIQTLDLYFRGFTDAIAAYLIPHSHGAVLVECGPGSTSGVLESGLQAYGLKVGDISDVLLTHIHLDHAGAAGRLAQAGARIHVHAVGAPHLLQPEKLLSSARRIYGDLMESLWGEFLPVPQENLHILEDKSLINIGNFHFRAFDTPGHANHHMAYLLEDALFTGDIGGVRLGGLTHLRLPMPRPDLNLEVWQESHHKLVEILAQEKVQSLIPTHLGIYYDHSGIWMPSGKSWKLHKPGVKGRRSAAAS